MQSIVSKYHNRKTLCPDVEIGAVLGDCVLVVAKAIGTKTPVTDVEALVLAHLWLRPNQTKTHLWQAIDCYTNELGDPFYEACLIENYYEALVQAPPQASLGNAIASLVHAGYLAIDSNSVLSTTSEMTMVP